MSLTPSLPSSNKRSLTTYFFFFTVFIKIEQQIDFTRPGLAMAVLQTPLSLIHCLTDSSFSYCVSCVPCQSSIVKAFIWYQRSYPLLVIFNNICLTTHIFETSCLLSFSCMWRVSKNSRQLELVK